jgi:hypothetical protein
MMRDEAPAATTVAFNGKGNVTALKSVRRASAGSASESGPTSLVAAEIHLGRKPAGICDGWLHCNIQVACHAAPNKLRCNINDLILGPETCWPALPLITGRRPKI